MPHSTASRGWSRRRPFFSLKWKAVFLLSLILAAVNFTLVWMNLSRLEQQFLHQRQTLSQRQMREFTALLEHSFSNLERVPPLLVDTGEHGPSPSFFRERLARELKNRRPALEIDWDITTIYYMDPAGKIHYTQGEHHIPAPLETIMRRALSEERSQRLLICRGECRQYVATPLLNQGELAGVLLLGRTVADAVYGFRRITGSDLAILAADEKTDRDQLLKPWNRRLALASNSDQISTLLQALAAELSYTTLPDRKPLPFEHRRHYYDLLRIPGRDLPWQDDNDYLVISDITDDTRYIQEAHRQAVVVGLGGFLASEILLLLLLGPPMARLRRLATLLPRLAEGRGASMTMEVAQRAQKFEDEIDVATRASAILARRLELLNRRVEARTLTLTERSEALRRERDFVSGLLQSAQVAILTLDTEGKIQSINPEAERVLGPAKQTLLRRLPELLEPAAERELERALDALTRGRIDVHRHEGDLKSPSGRIRTLSWVHSRLPGTVAKTDDACILSVGLDVTERKEAEASLAWLADHDPLTELVNRRRFQEEFRGLLLRSLRYHHAGALLFIDLDQFKYVNDTSGHQAGDLMLKMVAASLKRLVRESDLLARLGGDEFALVMPEADAEGARQMASRILEALSRIELPTDGHVHRVSASVGIALFPEHGEQVQDLMAHADLAMYQAKEIGRNRWHLFSWDEQRRKQLNEEVYWKQRIESALSEERLFLEYQPILEIASGHISHYEVLVRMLSRDGKVALPGKFIPVAERTGLIHRIDRLVLERAIDVLATHPKADFALSINLSGKVVDEHHFLPMLESLLKRSDVAPQRLLIEITETAALADMPEAARLMAGLRALGCRTALDDFGAGFSSFYYLRELALDMVKIDGSFIRHLPSSREDQLFVKAISEVAQGLGKQTVAEFVEDQETLEMLARLGVDYAQGYHIGRPGPLPHPAPGVKPAPV